MWQGREDLSAVSSGSRKREFDALSWTLKILTDNGELPLPFVEGIPAFCATSDNSRMMSTILKENQRVFAGVMNGLIALLQMRNEPGGVTPTAKRARSIATLNALAALCQIYSPDPWDFLCTYERTLRLVIMPMTIESDREVADAAKNAAASVVKRVHCCILLHRPLNPHTEFEPFLGDKVDLHKAFIMLEEWDALEVLAKMIPGENEHHLTRVYSVYNSELAPKYATCVLVHMAALLQRSLYNSRSEPISTLTRAFIFGHAISNNKMHPIPIPICNPSFGEFRALATEVQERTARLYEKLPSSERSKLSNLPGTQGPESLFLCRGHTHLLIALLEPFCALKLEADGALKLVNRTIKDMLPHLDARYSCRRDQTQLIDLCKAIFDSRGKWKVKARSLRHEFINQLLGVLGTISDPCLLEAARSVIESVPWSSGGEATAAFHKASEALLQFCILC